MCENNAEEDTQRPRLAALDNLNFHSNDIQWEEMAAAITQRVDSENFSSLSPNEHLQQLMDILIDVAYKYVPCKKSSTRGSHTKIPRARRILMRKRRKLIEKLEKSTGEKMKDSIRKKLIQIEVLIQKSHFEARSRKEQLAVKAIKSNSKYFFSYAKQFSSTRSSIGPLLNQNNEYTASSSKWQIYCQHSTRQYLASPLIALTIQWWKMKVIYP